MRGHRTAFGARHAEQALLRLKPGGRLVAIVGRGMALERPTFRKWWAEIGQRYHLRANLGIDGSAYTKFGTTFDNRFAPASWGVRAARTRPTQLFGGAICYTLSFSRCSTLNSMLFPVTVTRAPLAR